MPSVFGGTLLIARDQATSETVAKAGGVMGQFRNTATHCESDEMECWPQLGVHVAA